MPARPYEKSTIRYESVRIGRLAAPLVVAQLSQVGMGVTDTVMAGRLGAIDLAAVAMGSSLWIPVYLGCVGLMMAVSAMVAQLKGKNREPEIGPLYRQALWLALGLGMFALLATRNAGILLGWAGVDKTVIPLTLDYLNATAAGMPGVAVYLALRFLSDGIGHTRPIMFIQLGALALNAVGNHALMFGKLGAPALGAVGAGWSTAMVFWVDALALTLYAAISARYRALALFRRPEPPNIGTLRALLRLGIPLALVQLLEIGLFSAVALLMGSLGPTTIAAHQIAINYAALVFMVPLGIGMATTVRVGYAAGAGNIPLARLCGFVGMGMAAAAMLVSAVIMLTLPHVIVNAYTSDPAISGLAVELLFMAALFQVSDGLQAGALGALRGIKDGSHPLRVTVVAYWLVGLPVSWTLGIALEMGPRALWVGLVLGLSIAATLMTLRFHRQTRCHTPTKPVI